MKIWNILYLLFIAIATTYAKDCITCKRTFEKIGCFKHDETLTPKLLITDIDETSYAYSGIHMDWNDYEGSLRSLVCRCLTKTKSMNYKMFGIVNKGDCYAGTATHALDDMIKKNKFVPLSNCVNTKGKLCNVTDYQENCSGKEEHQYIYLIKTPIVGGWTSWSTYSACNSKCGTGIKIRTRNCTNPRPQYGGDYCIGSNEDLQQCNLHNCPRDGGFSAWSYFSPCTKKCGGGTQQRNRSCTNPFPAYGGKPCIGKTIETKICNTQKCLAPWICKTLYTPFNSDGNGDVRFLDRHNLLCPKAYAINTLQLHRDTSHTKYRYKYDCCAVQSHCTNRSVQNSYTYDGTAGNARYLDRQTVQCNDQYLTSLKLERDNLAKMHIRYVYNCCALSTKSKTCVSKSTGWTDDGNGNAIYLDRQIVKCDRGYSMTSFKLERNPNTLKHWRYLYRCCKTNQVYYYKKKIV